MRLEGDACCSGQCAGRFIGDKDRSSESFFVAGALFGEVPG